MTATILAIDDDPHIVRLVSYTLEGAGYRAVTARNGAEAIERLSEEVPDLVICDIAMPLMDGFETVAAIRADECWAHLPVVMLTALGQQKDIDRALAAGADAYLTKPFSSRELLDAVEEHLGQTE